MEASLNEKQITYLNDCPLLKYFMKHLPVAEEAVMFDVFGCDIGDPTMDDRLYGIKRKMATWLESIKPKDTNDKVAQENFKSKLGVCQLVVLELTRRLGRYKGANND